MAKTKPEQQFLHGNKNFPILFIDDQVIIYRGPGGNIFVLKQKNEESPTLRIKVSETGFEVTGQRGVLSPGKVQGEETFTI